MTNAGKFTTRNPSVKSKNTIDWVERFSQSELNLPRMPWDIEHISEPFKGLRLSYSYDSKGISAVSVPSDALFSGKDPWMDGGDIKTKAESHKELELLKITIRSGDVDGLKKILEERSEMAKAFFEKSFSGVKRNAIYIPIIDAVSNKDLLSCKVLEMVELLLKHGAEINLCDSARKNCLHYAYGRLGVLSASLREGHPEISSAGVLCRKLQEAGQFLRPDQYVGHRDYKGRTPFQLGTEYRDKASRAAAPSMRR